MRTSQQIIKKILKDIDNVTIDKDVKEKIIDSVKKNVKDSVDTLQDMRDELYEWFSKQKEMLEGDEELANKVRSIVIDILDICISLDYSTEFAMEIEAGQMKEDTLEKIVGILKRVKEQTKKDNDYLLLLKFRDINADDPMSSGNLLAIFRSAKYIDANFEKEEMFLTIMEVVMKCNDYLTGHIKKNNK